MNTRTIGLISGLIVFIAVLLAPTPAGLSATGQAVAAITLLMAIWWMTEAIPIAATSLLPIILYPLLEVADSSVTTKSYGHHLVFLMLGGFIIAQGIERWGLHRRIALTVIGGIGRSANLMLLGFMLATALLSMWISNAATTVMMVPIALAVVSEMQRDGQNFSPLFATGLMLAIAYSASIGGTATLIGTPPNVVLAGQIEALGTNYRDLISMLPGANSLAAPFQEAASVDFLEWMLFALPIAALMLLVVWVLFTQILFRKGMRVPIERGVVRQQLQALGRTTVAEKRVLMVFILTAAAWILRGSVDLPALNGLKDGSIAIAGALLMFLIPSGKKDERLMDWQNANKLPWSTLLLFGGGLALALGFRSSGLDKWLGHELGVVAGLDTILMVLVIVAVVVFLTEVTSNTATATVFIPIMSALAMANDMNPMLTMISAAVAASYAFMLPVATPPNAIVFGSGHVSIAQMMRTGLWLNLIGTIILTLAIAYWMPLVLL